MLGAFDKITLRWNLVFETLGGEGPTIGVVQRA
jgi:hypothetical protein